MNRIGTSTVAATAAIVALVLIVQLRGPTEHPSAAGPAQGDLASPSLPPDEGSGASPSAAEAWVFARVDGLGRMAEVHLRDGDVLATVNGVALTTADLGIHGDRVLSPDRYAFLLDRAVHHEVTRQAAAIEGIVVDPEVTRRLEERQAHAATGAEAPSEESAEFLRRELTTPSLLETLASRRGVAGRHVTPEHVEAHYAAHVADYGPLPDDPDARRAAWKALDLEIRQDLAGDVATAHDAAVSALADDLRDAADLDLRPPQG